MMTDQLFSSSDFFGSGSCVVVVFFLRRIGYCLSSIVIIIQALSLSLSLSLFLGGGVEEELNFRLRHRRQKIFNAFFFLWESLCPPLPWHHRKELFPVLLSFFSCTGKLFVFFVVTLRMILQKWCTIKRWRPFFFVQHCHLFFVFVFVYFYLLFRAVKDVHQAHFLRPPSLLP